MAFGDAATGSLSWFPPQSPWDSFILLFKGVHPVCIPVGIISITVAVVGWRMSCKPIALPLGITPPRGYAPLAAEEEW